MGDSAAISGDPLPDRSTRRVADHPRCGVQLFDANHGTLARIGVSNFRGLNHVPRLQIVLVVSLMFAISADAYAWTIANGSEESTQVQ